MRDVVIVGIHQDNTIVIPTDRATSYVIMMADINQDADTVVRDSAVRDRILCRWSAITSYG